MQASFISVILPVLYLQIRFYKEMNSFLFMVSRQIVFKSFCVEVQNKFYSCMYCKYLILRNKKFTF